MIKYSDVTLNECLGDFRCVTQKMHPVTKWMLKSRVSAITDGMGFNYTMHFWDDGRAVIYQSDRPMGIEVPDSDLRELSKWCTDCGWQGLYVADRLLTDPQEREFWFRMFMSGLINSDTLKRQDDEQMKRMSAVTRINEDDE